MTRHCPSILARQPAVFHIPYDHRLIGIAILASVVGLLQACASSVPVPSEQMAGAAAAVDHARSAGANELAPAELRVAIDKLVLARQNIADEHNERARMLADEVVVDARLAEVKSRAAQARKAADGRQEDNRVLREETRRVGQ